MNTHRVKRDDWRSDGVVEYIFHCPGCEHSHSIPVGPKLQPDDQRWTFNNNLIRPTFQPSLNISWKWTTGGKQSRCHSFIRDGHIQFLGDCTHALAGQTVEIPVKYLAPE